MVLNISPEDEARLTQFFEDRIKKNEDYSIVSNNCSSNVADSLESIGIHVYGPWQMGVIAPADILINLPKTGRVTETNWYGQNNK